MSIFEQLWRVLRQTFMGWRRNAAMVHAAAIAYWLILSIVPLLVFSIGVASQIFVRELVEWRILSQVEQSLGPAMADAVGRMLVSSQNYAPGRVAAGISILFILYSASNIFIQLQESLDAMWGVGVRPSSVREGLVVVAKTRLVAAASVIVVGFLLLGSIFVAILWTAIPDEALDPIYAWLGPLTTVLRVWTSPLIYTLLFALIFKALPHATIRWRDVFPGAVLTALLFWLGGYVIGLYLGMSTLASLFGAASFVIVALLWAYYSAWIILFGAKFTQIYAAAFGQPVRPYSYAVLLPNVAGLPASNATSVGEQRESHDFNQ